MRPILITGGTGLIGRHVAKRLCAHGYAVRILSRRAKPHVPLVSAYANVAYVQGDVRDPSSLPAAFAGCAGAVLAHQFHNFPVENPHANETFDAVDRAGTHNCVIASQHARLGRLVYISGSALDRPNPPHPGLAAKLAAERLVLDSGIPAVALRVNVVYASDDKYFSVLARAARYSPLIPIPAGGITRCAPIYVEDVTQAITYALERLDVGGVVSVCGSDTLTWKALLLAVAETGSGQKRWPFVIPTPVLMLAGAIGERLKPPRLSREAVVFATQLDQSCAGPNCDTVFGFQLTDLRAGLLAAFGR